MNTFRTPETPLRATYMTQDEANEVMELWSERQREEAARLSLVTVHDVAEAIQVSPEQVDHLLNEVRLRRIHPGKKRQSQNQKSIVLPGPDWAWLVSGIFCLTAVGLLAGSTTVNPRLMVLALIWGIALVVLYSVKCIDRWVGKQAAKIAINRGHFLSNDQY